ncbi:MAG TPA: ATP-binding protein [Methanocorpusculum sp.]|nr:ATP-binding protein [Methanocorpusculum sp.]
MMEFKRDYYLDQLIRRKHNSLIKVVTGIRRCGKSYLLFTLFVRHLKESGIDDDHIIALALDDRKNKQYRDPDALLAYLDSRIVDASPYYILLDEIQYVPEFEDVLNSLLHIPNADTYVTGSNSRFLASDIITEFRGRSSGIHVYPLSFSEYYAGVGGDRQEALDTYLRFGGIPLVCNMTDPVEKGEYLKELFTKIYLADLKQRHGIRHDAELEELIEILASSIGYLTNPKKISDTFRSVKNVSIAPETITAYLKYLMDAFLIERGLRYDIRGKKYISTPSKYYFSDIGLRNACLDFHQMEENYSMENVICMELKKRGYKVDVGVVTVTEPNKNGVFVRKQLEVDFVITKGYNRKYIQSVFSWDSRDAKVQQEEASLRNIDDSFERIIVLRNSGLPYRNEKGYLILSLSDFLLKPELVD